MTANDYSTCRACKRITLSANLREAGGVELGPCCYRKALKTWRDDAELRSSQEPGRAEEAS